MNNYKLYNEMRLKPRYKIIFILIVLFIGCESHNKKEIKELRINIEESLNQIKEIENNLELQKSPMEFFALNSNTLSNWLINELGQNDINTDKIFSKLELLKRSLITHNINDSLIEVYQDLLTLNEDKIVRKSKIELEKKILKANYLFINEMLNAIKRIRNHTEPWPYIVPIKTNISTDELMEAFIILPDPKNTKLIFVAPDSLKFDARKANFIYLSGKPSSQKDSILVEAIIKKDNGQDERIKLKKYFFLQHSD